MELNKTCLDAILKALSTVKNENRRNKVFTMIKQLKMREYSKNTYSADAITLQCCYSVFVFDLVTD